MEFQNIMGFLTHMRRVQTHVIPACHLAVDKAAEIIEKEAKAAIGHYQEASGPFQKWPELEQATKDDRVSKGFEPNDPLERTGKLRDSIERKTDGLSAAIGSNDDIAVYQEQGTEKIPARSFLGGSAFRKADEVVHLIGHRAVSVISGSGSIEK